MIECDVAIVGAGPAGCASARECTRKGLKTVIVEKKRIPRHKACSGILVPDSINALSEHFETCRRMSWPPLRTSLPCGWIFREAIRGISRSKD